MKLTTLVSIAALLTATSAQADAVADFYRGKNVNVLIGVAVGGEYDLHARIVSRYIGKYSGQSRCRPAEYDGRRRSENGELSL